MAFIHEYSMCVYTLETKKNFNGNTELIKIINYIINNY